MLLLSAVQEFFFSQSGIAKTRVKQSVAANGGVRSGGRNVGCTGRALRVLERAGCDALELDVPCAALGVLYDAAGLGGAPPLSVFLDASQTHWRIRVTSAAHPLYNVRERHACAERHVFVHSARPIEECSSAST